MTKLIVMLTYDDETVRNASLIFRACKDLPVEYWGFKNIGLPKEQMKALVGEMKAAGKQTFLEVVTLTERDCREGAELAVECGFDFLMGTVFHRSVLAYCKERGMRYLPFCGQVDGHPSILSGTPEEIAGCAAALEEAGCTGTDLLAYRHPDKPEEIIRAVVKKVGFNVCVAGSIGSFDRIDLVQSINPWTFTIGTALFDGNFGPDKSFRGQLQSVISHMNGNA
jgi:hypothetical protein